MRRVLLVLVVVLLIGGLFAWQMQQESGYVLIAFGNYSVDMSVWTALFLLLVFALLWRVIRWSWRLVTGQSMAVYKTLFRNTERERLQTAKGMLQFVEGRWPQAVRTLKKTGKHTELPLVNCLTAAYAALESGDYETVRELLQRAEHVISRESGGDMFAADLLRARLLDAEQHSEEALALLTRLHRAQPDHVLVLRMMAKIYQQLGEWQALEKLLPDIRRYRALAEQALAELEIDVYTQLLRMRAEGGSAPGSGVESLIALWQELPARIRRSREVMTVYLECLQLAGDAPRAEKLLRRVLQKDWDDALVRRYGLIAGADVLAQLTAAERWLSEHPDSAELHLALGRLCQHNELWGKARDYFESSLSLDARPETYLELARLHAQLGEYEKSMKLHQRALQNTR